MYYLLFTGNVKVKYYPYSDFRGSCGLTILMAPPPKVEH